MFIAKNPSNFPEMLTDHAMCPELNLDEFVDMLDDMNTNTQNTHTTNEIINIQPLNNTKVIADQSEHSTPSINQLQSSTTGTADQLHAGIANITDFCPEWCTVEGGTKMLVTGPWYSTKSSYTVLFNGLSVNAKLIQSGVLRCYTPGKISRCSQTIHYV